MPHLYKTFFDASLLVLWGDKASDDGKRARLTFGFRDGRPRLTVNTGAQGKEGLVIYPADVSSLTATMLYLNDVANGPVDNKITNESLAHVYVDNKATAEKKVRASLIIGKTKDGVVFITVIAEGYPKIIFPFKPSDYHVFRDNNRNLIPASDISVKMALAYSEQVRLAISQAIIQYSCEEYDSGDRKLTSIDRAAGGNSFGSNASNAAQPAANKFQDLDDLAL
jgi:hypothetical protein